METIIRVEDLRMRYGDVEAVQGVDLEVRRGEIFALLGPNGAGKTTTVEILEGYRRRTSGRVVVLGADPQTADAIWRGRVGVVLQDCVPEPELNVEETLAMYAGFFDRPLAVAEVLRLVGLEGQSATRNERLSGGQQRRLDFGLALVGDPEVIFLDEPTTGFDPAARRAAWRVVSDLRALGKTIVLTTHYLEEAEALADRIAVMVGGRIVAEGTPATLGGRDRAPTEVTLQVRSRRWLPDLPEGLRGRAAMGDGCITILTSTPIEDVHALCGWALDQGVGTDGLEVRQPSLEDVYLRLSGGEGR
jgi:ABC-2 type transport system ATP-binding protein